jgi:hypothetical protein
MPDTRLASRAASPERRMTMLGAAAVWIGLELAVGGLAIGAASRHLFPAQAQGVTAAGEAAPPWRD